MSLDTQLRSFNTPGVSVGLLQNMGKVGTVLHLVMVFRLLAGMGKS